MHAEGSRQGCTQRDPDKDARWGIQARMHTEGSRQGCTQRDPDKDARRGIQARMHTRGTSKDAQRGSLLTHSVSLLPVCLWALKGRWYFLYSHASIFLGFSLRAYFRESDGECYIHLGTPWRNYGFFPVHLHEANIKRNWVTWTFSFPMNM